MLPTARHVAHPVTALTIKERQEKPTCKRGSAYLQVKSELRREIVKDVTRKTVRQVVEGVWKLQASQQQQAEAGTDRSSLQESKPKWRKFLWSVPQFSAVPLKVEYVFWGRANPC